MKIYFYRPGDDQFWLGCDILHYLYMQRRRKQEPRGARLCAMYRQLYGLKSIKELPEVFFNVLRDLKVCFLEEPYFPIGPMWNGYCPFRMCDQRVLESPKELMEIEMTLGGKPFSQINWDEEGWL